jgi:hypothetical protein
MAKHEWRKSEKAVYLPKNEPELIDVPAFQFLTIEGEGSPSSELFSKCIEALYTLAYAIKMTPKKMNPPPEGFSDYTVYPLEGIWDLTEEAKKTFDGAINKDDFVFKLMIRQPDFVDESFFSEMLAFTQAKKPTDMLRKVEFETISDGLSVQMLHIGSYDNEPASFKRMEEFARQEHLVRGSKAHREIYLSDFRKVPAEKLKTVLRFKVRREKN